MGQWWSHFSNVEQWLNWNIYSIFTHLKFVCVFFIQSHSTLAFQSKNPHLRVTPHDQRLIYSFFFICSFCSAIIHCVRRGFKIYKPSMHVNNVLTNIRSMFNLYVQTIFHGYALEMVSLDRLSVGFHHLFSNVTVAIFILSSRFIDLHTSVCLSLEWKPATMSYRWHQSDVQWKG